MLVVISVSHQNGSIGISVAKPQYNSTSVQIYPSEKENFVVATAFDGKVDQAKDEAEGVLRRRRHVKPTEPDNFGISSAEALISQFDQLIGTVVLVTIVISSIGLLVGGIGVMNIMLVSVTERTREIGVRKALGARRRDIIGQFLVEAMTLTGVGGVLGIVIAVMITLLVGLLVPSLPSRVPSWALITGFTVSVAVGVFFGVWPAFKAAQLDPVEALRYE